MKKLLLQSYSFIRMFLAFVAEQGLTYCSYYQCNRQIFESETEEILVCKLVKALYGPKHASRCCYEKIKLTLNKIVYLLKF